MKVQLPSTVAILAAAAFSVRALGDSGPLEGRGHGAPLQATADGPLCFTKLAPGRYRIEAELDGVTRTAGVTIPRQARHPVHVALAFPATAARGDLELRPTPQEREEARTP